MVHSFPTRRSSDLVKSELATEPINLPTRFKTGWLVWQEIGHIVTRPEITVKITIHAEEAPEG